MVCPPDSPLATHQPDSTGTTVPNTPASTDIDVPQGEFARLTPSNRFARLAFSQVVEMILHDPDHYTHTQDFIRFAKAGEEDGFSELSDLGEGMRAPSPPFRLWNGYYRLNLKILPVYPHLGWILGSKPMGGNGQGADLLLTSKQGDHGIGGRHTRLMFHRNTGCLMLWAGPRSVSLHGSFGTVKLKFATRALTESASISMGDLQYRFDYQTLDEKMYKEDLDHFMKKELGETDFELSGSISSLGSDTDIQLKGYTIKGVFAAGTSAMVAGAIVKQTGEFVAVKKMRKASREDPTIACELDTLAALDRVHKHVKSPSPNRGISADLCGSHEFVTYAKFSEMDKGLKRRI